MAAIVTISSRDGTWWNQLDPISIIVDKDIMETQWLSLWPATSRTKFSVCDWISPVDGMNYDELIFSVSLACPPMAHCQGNGAEWVAFAKLAVQKVSEKLGSRPCMAEKSQPGWVQLLCGGGWRFHRMFRLAKGAAMQCAFGGYYHGCHWSRMCHQGAATKTTWRFPMIPKAFQRPFWWARWVSISRVLQPDYLKLLWRFCNLLWTTNCGGLEVWRLWQPYYRAYDNQLWRFGGGQGTNDQLYQFLRFRPLVATANCVYTR